MFNTQHKTKYFTATVGINRTKGNHGEDKPYQTTETLTAVDIVGILATGIQGPRLVEV